MANLQEIALDQSFRSNLASPDLEKDNPLSDQFAQLVREKYINPALEWLFNYHHWGENIWTATFEGGFSPFPEILEASGIMTTGDVLRSLLTPLGNYEKDVATWKKIDVESRDSSLIKSGKKYEALPSAIFKSIKFLVNSQSKEIDNGFAPNGDVFGVKEVSFSDATAAAVRGLLASLDFTQTQPNEVKQQLNNIVKQRVERGIDWLLENKKEENGRVFWPLTKYHTASHIFGTVLTLHALSDYLDRFPDNLRSNEIRDVQYRGMSYLLYLLNKNSGFLPFETNPTPKNKISITNTALALELLWKTPDRGNSSIPGVDKNNFKDLCHKEIKQLEKYCLTKDNFQYEGQLLDLHTIEEAYDRENKKMTPCVDNYYFALNSGPAVLSLLLTAYDKNELSESEFFKQQVRRLGLYTGTFGIRETSYVERVAGRQVSTTTIAGNILVFRKLIAKVSEQ